MMFVSTRKTLIPIDYNKIQNKVVKETLNYQGNEKYFAPKMQEIILRKYDISSNVIDSAFIQVIVEETAYSKSETGPLRRIRDYLQGAGNVSLDKTKTDHLKRLLNEILEACVETEQSDSLRRVLTWYHEELSQMKALKLAIQNWDYEFNPKDNPGFQARYEGFRANNSAMIRACEKDNFDMVMSFLNNDFYLNDSDFKKCEMPNMAECERKKSHITDNKGSCQIKWLNCQLSASQYLDKDKTDVLNAFRIFHATSKPSYLIANFITKINAKSITNISDPLSEAFHNAHIAKDLAMRYIEYTTKFKNVEEDSKRFLVMMLDLCKNTEEALLILSKDSKIHHYFTSKESEIMAYPRLELAVQDGHMEFVTHDYCQQVLRTCWLQSDISGEILPWTNSTWIDRLTFLSMSIVLMPLYVICFIPVCIFRNYQSHPPLKGGNRYLSHIAGGQQIYELGSLDLEKNRTTSFMPDDMMEDDPNFATKMMRRFAYHYTFPFNRFVAQFSVHLFYMCMVVLVAYNPLDEHNMVDVDWYDWTVVVFTLSYLLVDIRHMIIISRGKSGPRLLSPNGYDLLFRVCFLLGLGLKFWGFLEVCEYEGGFAMDIFKNCTNDRPYNLKLLEERQVLICGYCFYGIGMTLAIIKAMYWIQLNPIFGPMSISIRKVLKDLLLVGAAYAFFLFAFAIGIKYVLELSYGEVCSQAELNKMMANNSDSARNVSWIIKDDRNMTVVVGGNQYSIEDNVNQFYSYKAALKTSLWSLFDPGHPEVVGCSSGVPRYVALTLWWIYQTINVIILMNLLIAMMNTSLQKIQSDANKQWKFARTQIWLSFIEKRVVMPVPVAVLEIVYKVTKYLFSRLLRRSSVADPQRSNTITRKEYKRYNQFVRDLSKRYLDNMEDSKENEVTKEDLANAKRDICKFIENLMGKNTT